MIPTIDGWYWLTPHNDHARRPFPVYVMERFPGEGLIIGNGELCFLPTGTPVPRVKGEWGGSCLGMPGPVAAQNLKPCPFCGSRSVGVCYNGEGRRRHDHDYAAECDTCGAAAPYRTTRGEAAVVWNQRATGLDNEPLILEVKP